MTHSVRGGFTLLEVAVATMVVGLSLVAALQGLSQRRAAELRSTEAVLAASLVDAKLAELSVQPIAPGYRLPDSLARGEFERAPDWSWQARIQSSRESVALFDLGVEVRWRETLVSSGMIRLYRPPPTP